MFQLGNKLGLRRSAPVERNQAESAATLQGAQMALGRANKALETKTAELAEARSRLAQLEQTVGEKMADGESASAEVQAMQAAESLVKQLTVAVAVASQRHQEAATSLKAAERAAAEESKANALAKNKAVAVRIDEAFEVLRQLAQEHSDTWDAVCAGGADGYGSYRTDARLQFQLFLNLAAHPFTGRGHAPTAFMKFSRFSDCAPSPDLARTRTRA